MSVKRKIERDKSKYLDNIKNQWCEINKIKLLRLNYLFSKEQVECVLIEEIISSNPEKGSSLTLDYDKEEDKMVVVVTKPKKSTKK